MKLIKQVVIELLLIHLLESTLTGERKSSEFKKKTEIIVNVQMTLTVQHGSLALLTNVSVETKVLMQLYVILTGKFQQS